VLNDDAVEREKRQSPAIDEIPISLADLERVDRHGTADWSFRWSFAYARAPRRDPGPGHPRRTPPGDPGAEEPQRRADARDPARRGRVAWKWLLHVVFTLAGRLRPYNKYLPWELREHPLAVPEWSAEAFLPELELILAGDAAAIRRCFAVVDREVRAWDAAHGTTICGDVVDDWGDELRILRGCLAG
jgi:hypothetical protein